MGRVPVIMGRSFVCFKCLERVDPETAPRYSPVFEEITYPVVPRWRLPLPNVRRRFATDRRSLAARVADAERSDRLLCPNSHELPPHAETRRTIVVGVVGGPGASKTHYLCSLLSRVIWSGALLSFGVTASKLDDASDVRIREMYQHVFVDRQPLYLTRRLGSDEAPEPLGVVLTNTVTGETANLLFFDLSGEQLQTQAEMTRYARYIAVADGLLFFVDASALQAFRPAGGAGRSGGPVMPPDAGFIDNAAQLRDYAWGEGYGRRHRTSVAVVLSKSDVLRGRDALAERFFMETNYDNVSLGELLYRIEQESELVGELLGTHASSIVANAFNRFGSRPAFYAVSATGGPVVNGKFPKVEPVRCLDPLVKILYDVGFIP